MVKQIKAKRSQCCLEEVATTYVYVNLPNIAQQIAYSFFLQEVSVSTPELGLAVFAREVYVVVTEREEI